MSRNTRGGMVAIVAVYVVAIWIPLQYLPTRQYHLLPQTAVWLDDFLLAGLVLYATFLAIREPWRARSSINLPLLAFLAVALASAIWNRSTGIEIVLGLRALLQGVSLFYVLVILQVSRRHLVRLAVITIGLAVLQAPFACYQLATTAHLVSRDEVFGTMWRGASNSIAYFLLLVMLPLTGYWIRRPHRTWPLAALAAMLIPFVFSSSRGAYYLAPIVYAACFWPSRRNRRALAVVGGQLALSLVLFGFYYAVKPQSPGSEAAAELSPSRLLREQWDPRGSMGRLYYLEYLFHLFRREGPVTFLVGLGPARFSSTSGAYLGAPLLAQATRGAHSTVIPSQLIATLSEFGILGFTAFGWAIWRGITTVRDAARRVDHEGWRGFAEGAVGAGLFFALAAPLENIWELQFCACYFWAIVGAVTLVQREGS